MNYDHNSDQKSFTLSGCSLGGALSGVISCHLYQLNERCTCSVRDTGVRNTDTLKYRDSLFHNAHTNIHGKYPSVPVRVT